MKNSLWGKIEKMAVKLNMSKAYDRIEWPYLKAAMKALGFADNWIGLLMYCITTTQYSILLNGSPGPPFTLTRGLGQGDPLSSYLFLFSAEGPSQMLPKVDKERTIEGVAIRRRGTRVSHLFLANDSLLFCGSRIDEWTQIKNLLSIYERVSEQVVNESNYSVFFSSSNDTQTKKSVENVIGGEICGNYERYLGLPSFIGCSKYWCFWWIKDKLWQRVSSWCNNMLSQAGREVLMKAVLQVIPVFTITIFSIPQVLCRELDSPMAWLWWEVTERSKKVYWISWKKMVSPKHPGGLCSRTYNVLTWKNSQNNCGEL